MGALRWARNLLISPRFMLQVSPKTMFAMFHLALLPVFFLVGYPRSRHPKVLGLPVYLDMLGGILPVDVPRYT